MPTYELCFIHKKKTMFSTACRKPSSPQSLSSESSGHRASQGLRGGVPSPKHLGRRKEHRTFPEASSEVEGGVGHDNPSQHSYLLTLLNSIPDLISRMFQNLKCVWCKPQMRPELTQAPGTVMAYLSTIELNIFDGEFLINPFKSMNCIQLKMTSHSALYGAHIT